MISPIYTACRAEPVNRHNQISITSRVCHKSQSRANLEKLDPVVCDHHNLANTCPTESKDFCRGFAALACERHHRGGFLDIHNILCQKKMKRKNKK